MKSELILIAALSGAALLIGNAATAAVVAAGSSEADLVSTAMDLAAQGAIPSMDPLPLAIGCACACAVWLVWVRRWERRGLYRKGEEHGSARWATAKEIEAYSDRKDADNNIILTKRASIRLIDATHDQRTETNDNVLVIGGPGTGKTRYFVKPNLMQGNANYFITDPKGTLIHDMGHVLEGLGYEIKTFDTIDFASSMHFNPIAYIDGEAATLRFVECLIKNTTGDKDHTGDPFWENAEKLLYTALVSYLLLHCPEEDRNVPGLLSLLSLADAREDDEDYLSPLDMLFNELETGERLVRSPSAKKYDRASRAFDNGTGGFEWAKVAAPVRPEDDFALSSYKQFKVAAGKTLKSIMVSCNVRMKPFDIAEMREAPSLRRDGAQAYGRRAQEGGALLLDVGHGLDLRLRVRASHAAVARLALRDGALALLGTSSQMRPLHVRRVREHRHHPGLRAHDHRHAKPQHRGLDDPAVPLPA